MNFNTRRIIVLALMVVSIGLLIPGLRQPVLTIRGVLKPEGVAKMVPVLLDKGLSDDTIKTLKSLLNPTVVALIQSTGGDLRQILIQQLGPQITASLNKNAGEIPKFFSKAAASPGRSSICMKSIVRCPQHSSCCSASSSPSAKYCWSAPRCLCRPPPAAAPWALWK